MVGHSVEGEGMEDTFIDIANYGIIGFLVGAINGKNINTKKTPKNSKRD